ncbi:extracellular calcium-sensing receptor [Myxocyprinus asiaticus]|uniref:extracellular calcium-sensing receptor n=1 Tax=Myxocyprinus asiaticus TaxID=70543 RepID=UPI002222A58B|nr:extracellular calcium-sensing receptor [Myxocyprinus asiaticus]
MSVPILSRHPPTLLVLLLWAVWKAGMGFYVVEETRQEKCMNMDISQQLDEVGLYQDGDVIIGTLINVYILPVTPDLSFTRRAELQPCNVLQERSVRWAQAVVFAVEEINRNPSLLPGVRLGYHILDSCSHYPHSLRAAMSMISGRNSTCDTTKPAKLIIGDSSSTQCIILSRTLGPMQIVMISYLASCSCLSDRQNYPNFFRTIPSDAYQASTMAQMAKRFGWTWVGAVVADNDYGRGAVQVFEEEIKGTGICLAFFHTIFREQLAKDVRRAATTVQASSARVILVFAWYADVEAFLLELIRRNVTDRLFLASEIWSTSGYLLSKPQLYTITKGTLGVALRNAPIPGFDAHLRQLHPDRYPKDALLRDLWENIFGCSLKNGSSTAFQKNLPPCSGTESLSGVNRQFTDTASLRVTYNVYLAVYAAAHALHSLLECTSQNSSDPTMKPQCSSPDNITPAQLLQHIGQVNFTTQLGEEFYFLDGGIPPVYDLVNWQRAPDGSLQYVSVGRVEGSQLIINESAIQWPGDSGKVPVSVCTAECPPGTRKAIKKGLPVCCFDCVPCTEGEISNSTGSVKCYRCPQEFWSNSLRNECMPRETEFLSFTETMGITLTSVAVSGAVMTTSVAVIFLYHRNTPIVKANNSELSFLLLLSIKLCFLCSLVFVGQPSLWSCRFQQAAFGISFVLCISCILVKTIVVLVAFRSARPGSSGLMKWFGPGQQRSSVLLFTCVQVVICAMWLSISPPSPHRNFGIQGSKVTLECTVGSIVGFACVLGYIGFLAAFCFLLAFFARKLPDNFNEAKFITFSMLIFCAVWIAFVPAYVSSPGKYSVAVEIFAILSSSFGLLVCIFAPKCYIILLKPENNTKKFLMGKT